MLRRSQKTSEPTPPGFVRKDFSALSPQDRQGKHHFKSTRFLQSDKEKQRETDREKNASDVTKPTKRLHFYSERESAFDFLRDLFPRTDSRMVSANSVEELIL